MAKTSTSSVGERVPEITSSRCIKETTATLSFEVTDFLQLQGMGVGKFVTSRVFSVGGYDWDIRFYPDVVRDDCAGNASAYIALYLCKETYVRAKYTFSMLEKKSQVHLVNFHEVTCVFSRNKHDEWGHHKFVEKSKLESLSQLGDGCFTIRCVLIVVTDESPSLELPGHLECMLRDGRDTGVTFRVDGQEFRAHRSLLAARSPIFEAQLFGPMADKDMQCVKVIDMEPAIFEMILHYIYTDWMPICDDEEGYSTAVMQHLLVASDRYGVDRLKLMCEEELCKRIDAETITTTSALADQHHCKKLKDACLEFVSSEFTKVLSVTTATD